MTQLMYHPFFILCKNKNMNKIIYLYLIAGFIFLLSCKSKTEQSIITSHDIEKIDALLLGDTLKNAIEKLKIDTSQFYSIEEPPGILIGITINLGDSCKIDLFVNRLSIIDSANKNFRQDYLYIINEKIIGIAWEKRNKSKRIGSAI